MPSLQINKTEWDLSSLKKGKTFEEKRKLWKNREIFRKTFWLRNSRVSCSRDFTSKSTISKLGKRRNQSLICSYNSRVLKSPK